MRRRLQFAFLIAAGLAAAGCHLPLAPTPTSAVDPQQVVDLSYAFGNDTMYWPTAESFTLERTAWGTTAQGYWYAANNIAMAEHGGTHMDAPIHFAEGKLTSAEVPLASCIGPAVVVDVRKKADRDRDYLLSVDDLTAWEATHGRIPVGAIVLMNSGWGRYWGNKKSYLGTDKQGDVANLHFPGFSNQAAQFLVNQREIAAIGVDTASIDHGPSNQFLVHRTINGANKPAFENVANVDRLPPVGATIIALPMKITDGSGGPARIIAVLPTAR